MIVGKIGLVLLWSFLDFDYGP